VVATLTLASALVVNRNDVVTPFSSAKVLETSRNWDMGVELTKGLVELEFTYVVEVADYLAEPKMNNDMQQAFKDDQEKQHTADFLTKCRRTASKIIQNGPSFDSVAADFTAACNLHPEGWPQQICQTGKQLFLKEAQDTENFKTEAKGTTVQEKDDYFAKQVCENMQYDMMETLKKNQKAQESPFVDADAMKEEDEDKGENMNESEMEQEDLNPDARFAKDKEDYDPAALFAANPQKSMQIPQTADIAKTAIENKQSGEKYAKDIAKTAIENAQSEATR